MKISYAQNYEDIMIDRLFSKKKSGFYIDVGAAHPIKDSVTKYFYERGWSGVNIEPNEEFCNKLKKDRPRDTNLWCALGEENGEIDYFYIAKDPKISFIGEVQDKNDPTYKNHKLEKKKVKLRTLNNVCEEYVKTSIDFLKIDVEGAEEMVIKGIDLAKYQPRLILVESVKVKGTKPVHHSWVDLLTSQNYVQAYFDGINSYFVQSSDHEAQDLYSVPLNADDNFLRFQHTRPKFLLKTILGK